MLLLCDVHVPDSIAEVFTTRGHEIVHARDYPVPVQADSYLRQWGHELRAVLVTWDRDFLTVRRRPDSGREPQYNLSRLSFVRMPPTQARGRLLQIIELIEFEYEQVQTLPDKRLIMSISLDQVRIFR